MRPHRSAFTLRRRMFLFFASAAFAPASWSFVMLQECFENIYSPVFSNIFFPAQMCLFSNHQFKFWDNIHWHNVAQLVVPCSNAFLMCPHRATKPKCNNLHVSWAVFSLWTCCVQNLFHFPSEAGFSLGVLQCSFSSCFTCLLRIYCSSSQVRYNVPLCLRLFICVEQLLCWAAYVQYRHSVLSNGHHSLKREGNYFTYENVILNKLHRLLKRARESAQSQSHTSTHDFMQSNWNNVHYTVQSLYRRQNLHSNMAGLFLSGWC